MNATIFEQGYIEVEIPDDAPAMELELHITIADDHGRKPMSTIYTTSIYVSPEDK